MVVAELHQVLMEHEVTCHLTSFSLQLGGTALDSQSELRSIQGIQDGALFKVVEGNCLIFEIIFLLLLCFYGNKFVVHFKMQHCLQLTRGPF